MNAGQLTPDEDAFYGIYFTTAYRLLVLARACYVNPDPDNIAILKDPAFSRFAKKTVAALGKQSYEQRHDTLLLAEDVRNERALAEMEKSFAMFHRNPETGHVPEGMLDLVQKNAITGRPFPGVRTMIKALDIYMQVAHNRDDPRLLRDIAKAWAVFLDSDSPLAHECTAENYGRSLSKYAREGHAATSMFWKDGQTQWQNIESVLRFQDGFAKAQGLDYAPIRGKIVQIIKTYTGLMKPERFYHNSVASIVVSAQRQLFTNNIRKDFLANQAATLKDHRVSPLTRLEKTALHAMSRAGNFGQTQGSNSIFALTIEHSAPIGRGGGNYFNNLSIVSALVNYDMDILVGLQTKALGAIKAVWEPDKGQKGAGHFVSIGETYPIIILRPIRDIDQGKAPVLLGTQKEPLEPGSRYVMEAVTRKIIAAGEAFRPKSAQSQIVSRQRLPD